MLAHSGRKFRGAAHSLLLTALLIACDEPNGPAEADGTSPVGAGPAGLVASTRLTIDGRQFRINGAITYPSQPAEGVLMNVRMVNSVFEDTKRPSFDASANTDEFVARMREYVSARRTCIHRLPAGRISRLRGREELRLPEEW